MAGRPAETKSNEPKSLLGDIAHDGRHLLDQQIELFRVEVGQELRRAGGAVASVAAGGGLTAAGGILSGFMLAHLLHRTTHLPLWSCFGLVGGALGAAGVRLLRSGRDGFSELQPLPQTTAALGENVTWLKDQLTPTTH